MWYRGSISIFFAVAMFASVRAPCAAQVALIAGFHLDALPDGAARITVAFTGRPSPYRIIGTGSTELKLQMPATQTAPNVPPKIGGVGNILGLQYASVGSLAQLTIRLAAPAPVRVTADDHKGFPQISQRVATTSATVHDGETFVIGGLLQENELRSLQKIPILGDLPLIGAFFGTAESRARRRISISW